MENDPCDDRTDCPRNPGPQRLNLGQGRPYEGGSYLFFYCFSLTISLFPYIPSFFLHLGRGPWKLFVPCLSASVSILLSLFPPCRRFFLLYGGCSALARALGSGLLFLGAWFIRFPGFSLKKTPPFLSRCRRFLAPISPPSPRPAP